MEPTTYFPKILFVRQNRVLKIGTLILLVAVVTALHYGTATSEAHWHEVYKTLYFIPIILAAFWFDLTGAVVTSLGISLVYLPHVIFQWGGSFSYNSSRILMILLYNVVALVTGYLAQAEKRERQLYQEVAKKLDSSYETLKKQSDQLRLIEEKLRQTERL
jgi:two-component system sensor histidine kinase HydH